MAELPAYLKLIVNRLIGHCAQVLKYHVSIATAQRIWYNVVAPLASGRSEAMLVVEN